MKSYISFLRGINVSGQKKILMLDLKALLEKIGLEDVVTYIQSGNIIFKSERKISEKEFELIIGDALKQRYNFEVPVIVISIDEYKSIVADNVFLKEKEMNVEKLHVTFLADIPSIDKLKDMESINFVPDKFCIVGKAIYVYCPESYGNTKLSNTFFERKLKIQATTRNWKTCQKMVEIYTDSL